MKNKELIVKTYRAIRNNFTDCKIWFFDDDSVGIENKEGEHILIVMNPGSISRQLISGPNATVGYLRFNILAENAIRISELLDIISNTFDSNYLEDVLFNQKITGTLSKVSDSKLKSIFIDFEVCIK